MALDGRLTLDDKESLNSSLCRMFLDPNPKRRWREGTEKKSFNYLLLDPSVTNNLPSRYKHLSTLRQDGTKISICYQV